MAERFDNVWDAIIDDRGERESLKIKSTLMIKVEQYIKNKGLTQQQAAELMGVTQPKISTIVNGKLDRITIDMLVNMLAKVGVEISLNFSGEVEETDRESSFVIKFYNEPSDDYEWWEMPSLIDPRSFSNPGLTKDIVDECSVAA